MRRLIVIFALTSCFWYIPYSFSKSVKTGTISGYVLLSKHIDFAAVPKEAKVYIYVQDYTPQTGKTVYPWDAPIKKVLDFKISSLPGHKVSFQFCDLPEGIYGISVLVDTGRPHVPQGSLNFTAFPGDYAGGTKDNIRLQPNQSIKVAIEEGFYVTVPKGYEAPLFSSE